MSRKLSDRYVMPTNPTWLDFPTSDGQTSTWPLNTTRIVDAEGHVNYMDYCDLDFPTAVKWRVQAGSAIALDLQMPTGPNYVLREWPKNYRMFDHHKGPQNNPRHDIYLFGMPSGLRFRSINEFIPHAIWLMRNDPRRSCHCKYCTRQPQKVITQSMSGILGSTGSRSPAPSRTLKRDRKPLPPRDPAVYAAVQRAPTTLKRSANLTKHAMVVERNQDLRAVISRSGMPLRRWHREQELVWCALENPIKASEGVEIRLWPGIVTEVKLATMAVPRGPSDAPSNSSERQEENNVGSPHTTTKPNWAVKQRTIYQTRLLGVSQTYNVSNDLVIPYQAHVPPAIVLAEMRMLPPSVFDYSPQHLAAFNPIPIDGPPPRFEDAAAPYALAVELASTLTNYWSLSDEWTFQYTVPSVPKPTSHGSKHMQNPFLTDPFLSQPGPSQVPTGSASANGVTNTQLPPPSQPQNPIAAWPPISATLNPGTLGEGQRTSQRMLGTTQTSPPERTVTQTRFQGLWWGAERIWTDELVRLKVLRRSLAPRGAENILAPSGPGKAIKEQWRATGGDPSILGAGTRGTFMKMDGLVMVDAAGPSGQTRKECRACGMLYELADIDWEEEAVDEAASTTATGVAGGDTEMADGTRGASSSPLKLKNPVTPLSSPTKSAAPTPGSLSRKTSPLSAPASDPSLRLPEAPKGYRFRPILPNGYEAVLSLSLIAGRYYPGILSHPLLDHEISQAFAQTDVHDLTNFSASNLEGGNYLWALEGLTAGVFNSVDPVVYKAARRVMVEDASAVAKEQLEKHKIERMVERDEESARVKLVNELAAYREATTGMEVESQMGVGMSSLASGSGSGLQTPQQQQHSVQRQEIGGSSSQAGPSGVQWQQQQNQMQAPGLDTPSSSQFGASSYDSIRRQQQLQSQQQQQQHQPQYHFPQTQTQPTIPQVLPQPQGFVTPSSNASLAGPSSSSNQTRTETNSLPATEVAPKRERGSSSGLELDEDELMEDMGYPPTARQRL